MSAFIESLKPADEPAATAPAATADTASPAATPAAPEGGTPPPAGEAKKGEGKAKSPTGGLMGALKSERQKRQEAEQQLQYYRGLAEARGGADQPETKGPTDDELDNEILLTPHRGVMSRIERATREAAANLRFQTSDATMRLVKPDYAEKLDKFNELLQQESPEAKARIVEYLSNRPFPAQDVYDYVTKLGQQPMDEPSLRKKIEAEVEERLRKELALKEAGEITPTPAGKPGSGAAPAPADEIPTVDQLFEERRRPRR